MSLFWRYRHRPRHGNRAGSCQARALYLNEPSGCGGGVVAWQTCRMRKRSRARLVAAAPGNIVAIRSLREGVISDYEMTGAHDQGEFIVKVQGIHLFAECGYLRAVNHHRGGGARRQLMRARRRAQRVFLVEEPVAVRLLSARASTSTAANGKSGGRYWRRHDRWRLFRSAARRPIVHQGKVAGDKFDEAIVSTSAASTMRADVAIARQRRRAHGRLCVRVRAARKRS